MGHFLDNRACSTKHKAIPDNLLSGVNKLVTQKENIMKTTVEYSEVTKVVKSAVASDIQNANKWREAGIVTAAFYGSREALQDVKAQFIADSILPALDKKHTQALNKETVRKGSKEYAALDAGQVAAWEVLNQAKKDARAIAHTMFSRLLSYAFPSEKVEADDGGTGASLDSKLAADLAAWIKRLEKAEQVTFDLPKVTAGLKTVLALVTAKK